jgi:hypothetical protein
MSGQMAAKTTRIAYHTSITFPGFLHVWVIASDGPLSNQRFLGTLCPSGNAAVLLHARDGSELGPWPTIDAAKLAIERTFL